nr:hypothetical protein [Tanacetum cinerariifolium]
MTRKPFLNHTERETDILGIVHTDVCGPLRHVSRQVFETFKVFKNEVKNQLEKTIKAFRSDRGGEYLSQEFKDYLKACRIFQQLTPPYTPQHNGVSERKNHTLLDMVRSMMNLTTLPLSFWDYALDSATRILNMVPTKKADKTPYELWIPKGTMGYYFYFLPENKIVVARYAEFFEKSLITQEVNRRAIDHEEIQDEDTSPSEITSEILMDVKGFELPQEKVIQFVGGLNEPTSYKAAILDAESNKWLDAMNAEIQSMIDNNVWVLVDLPPNYKIVGSKWIFKKKTNMDGIVHTYKARLVAKGYTQLYGVDYEETFSPLDDIRAIRILISIAASYDYEIWQMDASGSNITFLILYVEDIIIMGNHIPSLQTVNDYLEKCFAMKDLREATFILGIKIYRDRSKRLIGLSQSAYMDKILKRYRMDNSKRGHIPMQERLDLSKTQGASTHEEVKRMQNIPYAYAVGSIMYAVRCIRPDVAFAQNITSRFQQNPDMIFILNGGAVDWKSFKQSTTAMFFTEAEYIVASEAAMEAAWIMKFFSGIGIVPTINEPIKMFCDNSAALLIANEPRVQKGVRHYHTRYHYVRECIELGEINLFKVHTYDNLVDPFTKALLKRKLTQHARSIGLRLASSFM